VALGAGAAAVALASLLAVWLRVAAEDAATGWAVGATAALGALTLAIGLVLRRAVVIPAALVLLGGSYGLLLTLDGEPLDRRAAAVSAVVFLVGELAYWALELRGEVTDEPGSYTRRLAALALLACGAAALAGGLLALVDLAGRGGIAIEIVGAGAALAVLVVLLFLTRQAARS
jgi:hypothetical protein